MAFDDLLIENVRCYGYSACFFFSHAFVDLLLVFEVHVTCKIL